MKKFIFVLLVSLLTFSSCSDQILDDTLYRSTPLHGLIVQEEFDWENADFMPTPEGREPIQTPWIGAGSLVGTYDSDVINDMSKSAGWVLLYNSFTKDPNAFTSNPYFILYNKYRGLMRIYYYVTDGFITTSSSVIDKIYIDSRKYIKLFSFADKEIIDNLESRYSLQHIQPKPYDGSMPVSAHRWYMAQYELAYDPQISTMSYNDIKFSFNLNYENISNIKLNGVASSELKGTIGEQSEGELSKAFNKTLKEGGQAALANVSYEALKKSVKSDGSNVFGIKKDRFDRILSSLGKVASNTLGGVFGSVTGLFSSIFSNSSDGPTPIYATINTTMSADGSITNKGAFPSMPISFYMPGTAIPASAPGRHPLYNKPLGVFGIKELPSIYVTHSRTTRVRHDDPYNPGEAITESWESLSCGQPHDYSIYLQFNPEVEKIADIEVVHQEVFAMDSKGNFANLHYSVYNSGEHGTIVETIPNDLSYYVLFVVEVSPKDGSPSSVITKTFRLVDIVKNYYNQLPEIQ